MNPPTPAARKLFAKLTALAEQGINGERDAAKLKLERLKGKYDFSQPDPQEMLFSGKFTKASAACLLWKFQPWEMDTANAVKWAIETAAGIPCVFRSGELLAQANAPTAARLKEIAGTIAAGFDTLWTKYTAAPGTMASDRSCFVLGLYEGMMNEPRENQALPARRVPKQKRGVKIPAGVTIHPYTIAATLGKRIRFCVPIGEIAGELDRTIKGEIEQ
jgi:hypothetical protein